MLLLIWKGQRRKTTMFFKVRMTENVIMIGGAVCGGVTVASALGFSFDALFGWRAVLAALVAQI